jgi:hypothetical protein
MSTEKRSLKVFLCHAHADRDPVQKLYLRLKKDGVDAWLDKAKLLPGQDWELEIRKAVREADVVAVCLSKQFNQAGFRQKEVRLALDTAMEQPEGEIFIIPARLEECETLESLRKWHWVDLFDDDGYEMLMRALRARADKIGATLRTHKSLLPNITTPHGTQPEPVGKEKISAVAQADKLKPTGIQKKRKPNTQILFGIIGIITVILIIGLSALIKGISSSLISTSTQTSVPDTFTPILSSKTPDPNEVPTKISTPTKSFPTLTYTPEIQQYFTEEFDNGYENWSYFLRRGVKDNFSLSVENGGLVFNMAAPRTYAYLVYEPVKYQDVRIDVHTQNLGISENNVTLFCRYIPGAGWYEFNISGNGLYNILFTKPDSNGNLNYGLIAEGGSNKINLGQAANEYSAVCNGKTLTLFINGVLSRTVDMPQHELSDGKVGFSVSSLDHAPVQVSLDWIRISKP